MTDTKPALPAETSGTEISRFNALRHGLLSRYTVLLWESADAGWRSRTRAFRLWPRRRGQGKRRGASSARPSPLFASPPRLDAAYRGRDPGLLLPRSLWRTTGP
jgi:hypothetical protein